MSATPESIALASTIVVQCKGDLSQARRSVAEALAWLQTVDPSHKPDPKPAAEDPRVAQLQSTADDLQRKLTAETDAHTRNRQNLLARIHDLQAEIDRLSKPAPAPAPVPPPAPAPVNPAPAPAPAAAPTPTPAPAAVDPYAGLPPKMRAFLAAQAGKGLEID